MSRHPQLLFLLLYYRFNAVILCFMSGRSNGTQSSFVSLPIFVRVALYVVRVKPTISTPSWKSTQIRLELYGLPKQGARRECSKVGIRFCCPKALVSSGTCVVVGMMVWTVLLPAADYRQAGKQGSFGCRDTVDSQRRNRNLCN